MNSAPFKTALKYAGAWSIVLIFVALLTIIFSFLGTLFCAAIGGMMMGATKAAKKLSVAFSVLCPGVLLATMRSQKTELPQNQVIVLAVLCLAAFWMLYVMSLFLVAYEKKGESAKVLTSTAQPDRLPTAAPNRDPANRSVTRALLNVEQLEGRWCSEGCGTNGDRRKRVLEICDGSLELSTLDAKGDVCSCARGRLNVLDAAEANSLDFSNGVELAAGI